MAKYDVRCCIPAWLSFSVIVDVDEENDSEEAVEKRALEQIRVQDLEGTGWDLDKCLNDPYVGPISLSWMVSDQKGEGAMIATSPEFVGTLKVRDSLEYPVLIDSMEAIGHDRD
tara:strand:- start:36 stop:377 length:342 start_codon:yes stop_codon:yes gene_type:complete